MNVITSRTPYLPKDVDYDGSRLEALNAHFDRLMKKNQLLGASYNLSRYGKTFAKACMGPKSGLKNETEPMQNDVLFHIYSITKIITATAIFKLAEDGYLRMLQPVKDFLPEMDVKPFNEITIANLLTHTSGLFPDEGAFDFQYNSPIDWNFIRTNTGDGENWIHGAMKTGMHCKPGTQWNYCTFGFTLLGEVISRITGMRAETWVVKNIFEPCGMNESHFFNDIFYEEVSNEYALKLKERYYVHFEGDARLIEYFDVYSKGERPDPATALGDEWYKISKPSTGGGVISTLEDLNTFGRMLLNNGVADNGNRIIGRKAIERMTENYTTPDIGEYTWGTGGKYRMYGLGPDTRRTADNHYSLGTFFHEGYGACSLTIDPVEKMVASWFVPYPDGKWIPEGLYNASAVMWSGIK